MFGVTDSTLLLIYALPIAGLLLGMLPAIFVWYCSKWWQKKSQSRLVDSVKSEFTLSL